jgi:hypothetical protein
MGWTPHQHLGHARDVTFMSPVRVAFGPKSAACHQTQVRDDVCTWVERQRELESEKTEKRNDGAASAALPSRGNKERPTKMMISSSS